MKKFSIIHDFTAHDFFTTFPEFRSEGTFTDLRNKPAIMARLIAMLQDRIREQLGILYWQGDTTAGAASPLRFMDGLVKISGADGSAVEVSTTETDITTANVFTLLKAVIDAIPAEFRRGLDNRPDGFTIFVSKETFGIMEAANTELVKDELGYLNLPNQEGATYYGVKIVALHGVPDDYIFATYTGRPVRNDDGSVRIATNESNLKFAYYRDVNSELGAAKLNPVTPNSSMWQFVINAKFGGNYAYSPHFLWLHATA